MQFETSVSYLEYVVPPIAHAQHRAAPAQCSPAVLALLEQLMQHLLSIKVTDAHRVLAHARALESFAGLTALRPQLAPLIIRKVRPHLACPCPHLCSMHLHEWTQPAMMMSGMDVGGIMHLHGASLLLGAPPRLQDSCQSGLRNDTLIHMLTNMLAVVDCIEMVTIRC